MAVDIEQAYDLIECAVVQDREDKLFLRWIVQSQYEMSFAEFKRAVMPATPKSEKRVLEDVFKIIEMTNKET